MAARGAEGLVLQRDGYRGQTLLSAGLRFGTDDVDYLRSEQGAAALAAVAEFELTDATRVADVAAARARFGERAPVLVETTLLRRRAVEKLGQLDGPAGCSPTRRCSRPPPRRWPCTGPGGWPRQA